MDNPFPDLNREIMAKTKISDSVFTNLFKDPEYTIQLYRALHPEDTTSTKDDVKIVTLENVLLGLHRGRQADDFRGSAVHMVR